MPAVPAPHSGRVEGVNADQEANMTATLKSMRRIVPALFLALAAGLFAGPRSVIRAPAVAGSFDPANPGELAKTVDALLAQPAPLVDAQRIIALVAPHAGYQFSGGVAGNSYAALKGRKVRR